MKKLNLRIMLFASVMILACCGSVLLFSLPAFFKPFDQSPNGGLGSATAGLTSPIIGIVSSILLYLALTRQIEANTEQKLKNESDMLFLLINQLEMELSNFYYKYNKGKEVFKFVGFEGLNEFAYDFRFEYTCNDTVKFGYHFSSVQVIKLMRSYELASSRIRVAILAPEVTNLFEAKLRAFYDTVLEAPLAMINDGIQTFPHTHDNLTAEIERFVQTHALLHPVTN